MTSAQLPAPISREILLRDALEIYKTRVSILKKGYAQESYRIASLAKSFLGAKPARSITSVDIAAYRDQRLTAINSRTGKPVAAATVRLELALLSHLFDVGKVEWDICDDNPISKVRKPKLPPGRDRRLTSREEKRILRYCHAHRNHELLAIVVLALETAMRQGEILKLAWEHINLKSRIARLPDTKNGSVRDVPLSLKARDTLVALGSKSSGRVFHFTNSGFKSSWRFMMKRLKIEDLHFHDLRHEAVSRLFELGTLDMMEIAAISGHKSLAMLKRYTHLKAANLVRKLEGQKNKARIAVLSTIVPYPALVTPHESGVSVRVLDFPNLVIEAVDQDSAIRLAADALLRRLLRLIRDAAPIPQPDQYLEQIDESRLVVLDPLGGDELQQN